MTVTDRATFEQLHAEHGIERRPHGFRGPVKYAVLVCPPCDKSLVIIDDEEGAESMARKKVDATTTEPIQPPLVPLTEEEVAELQKNLPVWIGELKALETKHAGLRAEMKAERADLQKRIDNAAQQLRQQGR